jgi:hypothetical protein
MGQPVSAAAGVQVRKATAIEPECDFPFRFVCHVHGADTAAEVGVRIIFIVPMRA